MNKELIDFINKSPSVFHVINNVKEVLNNNGFKELKESDKWVLETNNKYYVTRNNSSIIAFNLTESVDSFNIVASHSDSPTFKVKDNSEIVVENNYVTLNTEGYGGMIMSTWFDKPLSVAGRVIIKNGDSYETKLVDINRDSLIIPNVAIHMNREVNDGYKFNAQKDLLPLFSLNTNDKLLDIIAKENNLNSKDIIGHDLFLYNRTKGIIWGNNNEFISSAKLDDLQCAFTSLQALISSNDTNKMMCIFDNEEVGSLTKQGADSTFFEDTLKRINTCLNKDKEDYHTMLAKSFLISADNAHSIHPNHPELADPTNRPIMNKGIVIKYHAGAKYTSDAVSSAVFKDICQKVNVPTQVFTNRSDKTGGSTLGNLSNNHVSLNAVDIGLPQLAMHSSFETAGCKDTDYLLTALKEFYNSKINIK